jgi:hypothetical protein
MGKAGMSLHWWNLLSWNVFSWNLAWRDFRQTLAMKCEACGRIHHRSPWRRMRRWRGVRMAGSWYCRSECLEQAVKQILARDQIVSRREAGPSHRVPLGLLLLSRQQLTAEQLRTALAAQRDAGRGKIGEWLQRLGFSTESQITAALARQWSCPILRTGPGTFGGNRNAPIPALLLESFQMIPVELAEATGTLLIAFSEGIDHSVLYAIEQMLGYRTEACLVSPSTLRKSLEALAQRRGPGDVVFERMEDAGECAHIIASYSARIGAEHVRLARCGRHIWIRLERVSSETVNLVLRSPAAVPLGLGQPTY